MQPLQGLDSIRERCTLQGGIIPMRLLPQPARPACLQIVACVLICCQTLAACSGGGSGGSGSNAPPGAATPAITWPSPADITYGTALSSAQLDATANYPGTFSYTPAAGTILGAGKHTLAASFTP